MKIIKEDINSILKPKTEEEIGIPKDITELIKDCYEVISNFPNRFVITKEIGFHKEEYDRIYYGFDFEEYKHYNYKETYQKYANNLIKYSIRYNKEDNEYYKGFKNENVILFINNPKRETNDINIYDLHDFIIRFNLYKPITESIDDILKPKKQDEILKLIPSNIIIKMKNFYNIIKNLQQYDIIKPLGINNIYNDYEYGFLFHTKQPLKNTSYHNREIGEYRLLYDIIHKIIVLVFENNGGVFEIEDEKILKSYTDLDINENLEIFVNKSKENIIKEFSNKNKNSIMKIIKEDINSILKPKSKENIIKELSNLSQEEKDQKLLYLTFNNNLEGVKILIEIGANINAIININGNTPLHIASINGYLNIVKYLIKMGVNVNIKSISGETPLMKASKCDQLDVVKYLINIGADVNTKNIYGNTALYLAFSNKNYEIVDLLKKYGADES